MFKMDTNSIKMLLRETAGRVSLMTTDAKLWMFVVVVVVVVIKHICLLAHLSWRTPP